MGRNPPHADALLSVALPLDPRLEKSLAARPGVLGRQLGKNIEDEHLAKDATAGGSRVLVQLFRRRRLAEAIGQQSQRSVPVEER